MTDLYELADYFGIDNTKIEKNYDSIVAGDVIWAKRYKTEAEKASIPYGHRSGPYLVVGKKRGVLYTLPCSSSNDENKFYRTPLKSMIYRGKDTHVSFYNIMTFSANEEYTYICSICKDDLNLVYKQMLSVKMANEDFSKAIRFAIDKKYEKVSRGDVIEYIDGKSYYIDHIYNKKAVCFLLLPAEKTGLDISPYLKNIFVNVTSARKFDVDMCSRIWTCDESIINSIKCFKNNIARPREGSVLFKNRCRYLVYKIDGNKCYAIKLSIKKNNKLEYIRAREYRFYSDCKTHIFDVKTKCNTIIKASANELAKIVHTVESKSKIVRGDVLRIDRKLFLVSKSSDVITAWPVSYEETEGAYCVTIKSKKRYVIPKSVKLVDVDINMKFRRLDEDCEEEFNKIEQLEQSNIAEEKNKINKFRHIMAYFRLGYLYWDNYEDKQYIIVEKNSETMTFVNPDDFEDGFDVDVEGLEVDMFGKLFYDPTTLASWNEHRKSYCEVDHISVKEER